MRERIVRSFAISNTSVGSDHLLLEGSGGWFEKTEIFPQSFCGRKTAKTPVKENSSKAFSSNKKINK